MGSFTFFDFCAGIGSGRVAFQNLGGRCVGFSEIDQKAESTYELFFGQEKNYGDLMKINPKDLPEFDIMIGGFPCQAFSIVGKRQGMADARGQIINGLVNILKSKNIKYFVLENVKGILNHDGGQTLKKILSLLRTAGYSVHYQNLNSKDYGIPQKRERVYFVGVRDDIADSSFGFEFPEITDTQTPIKRLLSTQNPKYIFDESSPNWDTFINYLNNKYNRGKFSLKKLLSEEYLLLDTRQSDLRLYRHECPTLRTGRHGILYVKQGHLRRLSGEEGLLLQGFPRSMATEAEGEISSTSILSQAGNAMTINVMQAIGQNLLDYIGVSGSNVATHSRKAQISMSFDRASA